jgi:uncharacterized protein YggU (UPF0235/DUF167 family)
MRISLLVKPNSRKEKIERLPDGSYHLSVSAPAREDKANEAVIYALSKYLSVPKSHIQIVKGHHGKNKIIDILD